MEKTLYHSLYDCNTIKKGMKKEDEGELNTWDYILSFVDVLRNKNAKT